MNDTERKFLEGLQKLSEETGLAVGSCGCCSAIFLHRTTDDSHEPLEAERISWSNDRQKYITKEDW